MALVGGYENELVEPPQEDDQWVCSICLLIVREPHMVSCCGLRFCRSCIEQIWQRGSPCPHCQKRFTIQKDDQLKRLLMHKRVYCINKNAGCQWVGELKEAEKHVWVDCMWTEVVCPNECGQCLLRHMLNQHATEECPRCPRLCEFAAVGCDSGALTPNRLQNHMQESVQKHLTLVCKKLEEKEFHVALERSELEAKVVAHDTKIKELEKAVHAREANPRAGELEGATQVYEARIEALEAVVEAREARIMELEVTAHAHETKALEAKLQVRQGEVKELEAKLQARQAEVKELKARMQDREAKIKKLETSAEACNEELGSKWRVQEAKISELDAMVKARDVRIQKLTAAEQDYKIKLGEGETLLQDRDGQIRVLKTINDASEATVQSREAEMENLREELLKQDETVQDLKAKVEDCDASIRQLEAIVEAHNTRIKELEAMVEDREARVEKLEATAQIHEARVAKLEKMVKYRDFVLVLLGAALLLLTVLLVYVSYKRGISTSNLILIQLFSFSVFMANMVCKYWSKYASSHPLHMVCRDLSEYREYVVVTPLILYVLALFKTPGLYCLLGFGVNLAFCVIALYIEKEVKFKDSKPVLIFSFFCICVTLQNILVLDPFLLYLHSY